MNRLLNFTLYLIAFCDFFGFGIILLLFPSWILDLGSPFLEVSHSFILRAILLGALFAIFPLMQWITEPFFYRFSYQISPIYLLIGTTFFSVMSYAFLAISFWLSNLYLLFFSRALGGLFAGNLICAKTLFKTSPTYRKQNSLFHLFLGTGFFMGTFVGGKLTNPNYIQGFNDSLPISITSLLFFCAFLFTLFLSFKKQIVQKEIPPALPYFKSFIQKKLHLTSWVLFLLIIFCSMLGFNLVLFSFSTFLKGKWFLNTSEIANYYGLLMVGFLFSSIFLMRLFSRYLYFSLYLSLLVLFILPFFFPIFSLQFLLGIFFIFGCAYGLFYQSVYYLLQKEKLEISPLLLILQRATQVIAPLGVGFLLLYSLAKPLWMAALFFLFAFLITLITKIQEKPHHNIDA